MKLIHFMLAACAAVCAVLMGILCLFLLPFTLALMIFGTGVFIFVFWIWMLVDAIRNRGIGEGEKVGWVLAIVFLHIIGSTLYFIFGHPKRMMPGVGV
jgi:hypothetical protein